jgi:hypothetical protein
MKEATKGSGLSVRRIIRSAIRTMDQDAVDLVLLGMQQDRAALAAGVIHGMVTGFKDGRRF